jgi:hypothetical protein
MKKKKVEISKLLSVQAAYQKIWRGNLNYVEIGKHKCIDDGE